MAVECTVADLAALRIFEDDQDPDAGIAVAAGAPWFMTVFGRDSLLTSWMIMPFLPGIALGTLDRLADLQGSKNVPETEEQPGKIMHELRQHSVDPAFSHDGLYYGTVDATPLYVMLAAEAMRWGQLDDAGLASRWPSISAAVDWVRRGLAHDHLGFLRYERSTDVGLINQGWKDSPDSINFADGRLARGAIALAEAQGYAYAALRDAADLASRVPDAGCDPEDLRREADELAERYDRWFWNEAASSFVTALDGDDAQVDSLTTNPGHAIWTGLADPDHANRYLDRVVDEMFTGWGLRTLAPSCARYQPMSYHNGSVWPHDTAIVGAGAARLGRIDVVDLLFAAAFETSDHFGGRNPELFAGIDRSIAGIPVPYPSVCSPQAWASASTLLHLRSSLGLEPPSGVGPPTVLGRGHPHVHRLDGVYVAGDRYGIEHRAGALVATRSSDVDRAGTVSRHDGAAARP